MNRERNDTDREAGRSLPLPGRHQPVRRPAGALDGAAGARHAAAERRAEQSTAELDAHRLGARRAVLRRHHLDRGRRRGGLGRVGDAERRVGAGGDRRAHRRRTEPAGPELRDPARGWTLQRDRAGQAAPRHADSDAWRSRTAPRTSPLRCRAGTRRTRICSSSSSNIVEFGMTPQQAAEAPNIIELPDALLVRRARVAARGRCSRTPPCPTACAPGWRQWAIR